MIFLLVDNMDDGTTGAEAVGRGVSGVFVKNNNLGEWVQYVNIKKRMCLKKKMSGGGGGEWDIIIEVQSTWDETRLIVSIWGGGGCWRRLWVSKRGRRWGCVIVYSFNILRLLPLKINLKTYKYNSGDRVCAMWQYSFSRTSRISTVSKTRASEKTVIDAWTLLE